MIAVVTAICSAVVAVIGLYYVARSNARETARQRAEAMGKAIADATGPLHDEIAVLRQTARDRLARIQALEDELRRRP